MKVHIYGHSKKENSQPNNMLILYQLLTANRPINLIKFLKILYHHTLTHIFPLLEDLVWVGALDSLYMCPVIDMVGLPPGILCLSSVHLLNQPIRQLRQVSVYYQFQRTTALMNLLPWHKNENILNLWNIHKEGH